MWDEFKSPFLLCGGGLGLAVGEDGGQTGQGCGQQAGRRALSAHQDPPGLLQHQLNREGEEVAQWGRHPLYQTKHGEERGRAACLQAAHKQLEQRSEVLQAQPSPMKINCYGNQQQYIWYELLSSNIAGLETTPATFWLLKTKGG